MASPSLGKTSEVELITVLMMCSLLILGLISKCNAGLEILKEDMQYDVNGGEKLLDGIQLDVPLGICLALIEIPRDADFYPGSSFVQSSIELRGRNDMIWMKKWVEEVKIEVVKGGKEGKIRGSDLSDIGLAMLRLMNEDVAGEGSNEVEAWALRHLKAMHNSIAEMLQPSYQKKSSTAEENLDVQYLAEQVSTRHIPTPSKVVEDKDYPMIARIEGDVRHFESGIEFDLSPSKTEICTKVQNPETKEKGKLTPSEPRLSISEAKTKRDLLNVNDRLNSGSASSSKSTSPVSPTFKSSSLGAKSLSPTSDSFTNRKSVSPTSKSFSTRKSLSPKSASFSRSSSPVSPLSPVRPPTRNTLFNQILRNTFREALATAFQSAESATDDQEEQSKDLIQHEKKQPVTPGLTTKTTVRKRKTKTEALQIRITAPPKEKFKPRYYIIPHYQSTKGKATFSKLEEGNDKQYEIEVILHFSVRSSYKKG